MIHLNFRHLLPDLAPRLIFSGLNYPCLKQISTIQKMFAPLKFDSTNGYFSYFCSENSRADYMVSTYLLILLLAYTANSSFLHIRSSEKTRYQEKIFFLFLHKNVCCGYSLEAPWWGTSNEYHNICFCGKIRKVSNFWLETAS